VEGVEREGENDDPCYFTGLACRRGENERMALGHTTVLREEIWGEKAFHWQEGLLKRAKARGGRKKLRKAIFRGDKGRMSKKKNI